MYMRRNETVATEGEVADLGEDYRRAHGLALEASLVGPLPVRSLVPLREALPLLRQDPRQLLERKRRR